MSAHFRRNGLAILLALTALALTTTLLTATLLAALTGLIGLIRRLILLVIALATATVLTTLLLILIAHERLLFSLPLSFRRRRISLAACDSDNLLIRQHTSIN
jgi:hypothetical protein